MYDYYAVCLRCKKSFGRNFPGRGPQRIARFCSKTCQVVAWYQARRDEKRHRPYTVVCLNCKKSFGRYLTLQGEPLKAADYCGRKCRKSAAAKKRAPPLIARPCGYCGVSFMPKRDRNAVYCSQVCKKLEWRTRDYAAQRQQVWSQRQAAKDEDKAKRYRESAAYQHRRLIKVLRKVLRKSIVAQEQWSGRAKECKQCNAMFVASDRRNASLYCSTQCKQIAPKHKYKRKYKYKALEQRARRKRDIEQLRPAYLKRRLERMTGLKSSQTTPPLLAAKREQLLLHRSIKGALDVIHKTSSTSRK